MTTNLLPKKFVAEGSLEVVFPKILQGKKGMMHIDIYMNVCIHECMEQMKIRGCFLEKVNLLENIPTKQW